MKISQIRALVQKIPNKWFLRYSYLVLFLTEAFFLLSWFYIRYFTQLDIPVPYYLIEVVGNWSVYLCCSSWLGIIVLVTITFLGKVKPLYILGSAFCIFWATLALLISGAFVYSDSARTDSHIYHLVHYIDGENGRATYVLYECDKDGRVCMGEYVTMSSPLPAKIIIDEHLKSIAVELEWPHRREIIYERSLINDKP